MSDKVKSFVEQMIQKHGEQRTLSEIEQYIKKRLENLNDGKDTIGSRTDELMRLLVRIGCNNDG